MVERWRHTVADGLYEPTWWSTGLKETAFALYCTHGFHLAAFAAHVGVLVYAFVSLRAEMNGKRRSVGTFLSVSICIYALLWLPIVVATVVAPGEYGYRG